MTKKRLPADMCEMTAVPGYLTTRHCGYPVTVRDRQQPTHELLFSPVPPLSAPVPIATLNRSILLIDKPLSHAFDTQLAGFTSCCLPLLRFLQRDVFQYDAKGNTVTTLFFDQQASVLVAFCSTKCSSLKAKGDTPLCLCPSVEIVALCIDENYRYQGIGQAILRHLFHQVQTLRRNTGIQYLTLFALPDAVSFYRKSGFKKLGGSAKMLYSSAHIQCIPMYLPLPEVKIT